VHFHPDALGRALSYGYTLVTYFSQGFSAEQRRGLHQTIFTRRPIGIIASPFNFTAEDVALARELRVDHTPHSSLLIGLWVDLPQASRKLLLWRLRLLLERQLETSLTPSK
jgi:hypothetical protein